VSARIRYYIQLSIAWLLVIAGTLIVFSPFPLGALTLTLGLSLLIYTSEPFQQKLHDYRSSHHGINQRIVQMEDKLERRLRIISHTLQKTRPRANDE
jgi:hypothetical protein